MTGPAPDSSPPRHRCVLACSCSNSCRYPSATSIEQDVLSGSAFVDVDVRPADGVRVVQLPAGLSLLDHLGHWNPVAGHAGRQPARSAWSSATSRKHARHSANGVLT